MYDELQREKVEELVAGERENWLQICRNILMVCPVTMKLLNNKILHLNKQKVTVEFYISILILK